MKRMNNDTKFSKSIIEACTESCQKMVDLFNATRTAITDQFRDLAANDRHTLQLVLNEAEALAWQTEYPELVFPDLAEEKARGFMQWMAHQRDVRTSVRL